MDTQIFSHNLASSDSLLNDPLHREWQKISLQRQCNFFASSKSYSGGFDVLNWDGDVLVGRNKELHTVTRIVHSFSLVGDLGIAQAAELVDYGLDFIWSAHRDRTNGGYFWSVGKSGPVDRVKLAYGHVFVLLAASSAKIFGSSKADQILEDVWTVLLEHFWEPTAGLFCDEFTENWDTFSNYRGMNANMHAVEALLTAYEATDDKIFLEHAKKILDFFINKIAMQNSWRIPEHYNEKWEIDPNYEGDPMFRPRGSTPGHSFELSRLALQFWDLTGRRDMRLIVSSKALLDQALADAWDKENGGFVYTLNQDGTWDKTIKLWWPITEAIGALGAQLKIENNQSYSDWYKLLWNFAANHYIDPRNSSWYPEIDAQKKPSSTQFEGKPDIYHSLQAHLFPMVPRLSRISKNVSLINV